MFTIVSGTMARNSYVYTCIWHNGQEKLCLQLYLVQWPGIAMLTIVSGTMARNSYVTIVSGTMVRNSYVDNCIWHNGQE
jgi:hypothetical protein